MNGRTLALLATTALVAVGCDTGGDAARSGPSGLVFGTPVSVMSADADTNTVRVANDVATVELNDLAFTSEGDLESFSITVGLPDGTSVTMTDTDFFAPSPMSIGSGDGILLAGENADVDYDRVEILIGLGTGEYATAEEYADGILFALARVDPDADDDPGPDFGYDTYGVIGDETETLPPEGSAYYYGEVIASAYEDGLLINDDVEGGVEVWADFEDDTVDIVLEGGGTGVDFILVGENLEIDGSSYGGEIDGEADYGDGNIAMTGDLLGAFFGDDAEATAGVFGANETAFESFENDADVEIVGGFAAYEDEP